MKTKLLKKFAELRHDTQRTKLNKAPGRTAVCGQITDYMRTAEHARTTAYGQDADHMQTASYRQNIGHGRAAAYRKSTDHIRTFTHRKNTDCARTISHGPIATHGQPTNHAQIGTHEPAIAHSRTSVHGRKPAMLSAMILCLAVMLLTGGCGLAQGDFSLAREELPSSRDRLSGIFVTENYIEPAPARLEYNDRGEITFIPQETEKIYGIFNGYSAASLISFPGLEGYGLYSLMLPADENHEAARCNTCDNAFTSLHFAVTDEEESMEASLYVTNSGSQHYYFHPIYQQEDGQFYLLPGSGISSDSPVGLHFSHSIADSVSQTENGEETTSSYRFTVTIIAEEAPENLELLFLDSSDQVTGRLSADELDALLQADAPELSIPEDVACLILKQGKASGTDYTAYDPDSEYLEYKEAHGDGPLYPRQLHLIWP